MRKQYHFRKSGDGFDAWDVDKLVALTRDLTPELLPLADIAELDENFWFQSADQVPTCRAVVEHMRLVEQTDLSYPIIVDANGRVMDGMHRVAKALLEERTLIACVRLDPTPEPDFVDVQPDELDY